MGSMGSMGSMKDYLDFFIDVERLSPLWVASFLRVVPELCKSEES